MKESAIGTTLVPRIFREVAPAATEDDARVGVLEEFFCRHIVVVLGEPGMGKTTACHLAATQEAGSVFIPLGRFLNASHHEHWRDKVLYLDGLDEQRAKIGDHGVMDKLVGQLEAIGSPKVRLSCRTQEWHQGSDIGQLAEVSRGKPVTVLELQPLTHDDIKTIAATHVNEPSQFVDEAYDRGLYELLTNPEILNLFLRVVSVGKGWPETQLALFQSACSLLLAEQNETHQRIAEPSFSDIELQQAADELAAICLLSGVEGIALTSVQADDNFPSIQRLGGNVPAKVAAGRRNAFVPIEAERITPRHRMIGEFMAARHLANKSRAGLPLGRIMALITGSDGGSLSDLRGVLAWLICLLPENAPTLLMTDPYGAVAYGDPASWPPGTRKVALDRIRTLATEDPWFRSGHWQGQILGGLACKELVSDFISILESQEKNHLRSVAFDALSYGAPLPEIGDALLKVARDESEGAHPRTNAIGAFMHCCPDRWHDLHSLLNDIHEGRAKDKALRLRTALLCAGYPNHISPADIVPYLVPKGERDASEYGSFIGFTLVRRTADEKLIELADTLAQKSAPKDSFAQIYFDDLVRKLLERLIAFLGDSITPDQMYRWLGIGLTEQEHQILRGEDAEAIRNYLHARPDLWKGMFQIWRTCPSEKPIHVSWYRFQERLCGCGVPNDFAFDLLEYAATEVDPEIAKFYFTLAVLNVQNTPSPTNAATLEDLFQFAVLNPQFAGELQQLMYYEVPDWRIEQANRQRKWQNKVRSRREATISHWRSHHDVLREGRGCEALDEFAKIWIGLFADSDHALSPLERLVDFAGDELASVVLAGFEAILLRSDLPTPQAIAELDLENRIFSSAFAVMAGMEIIAERSQDELLALPSATVASALATNLAIPKESDRIWPDMIMEGRPDIATETLRNFWRVQLAAGKQPHGIYRLDKDEGPVARIATAIALELAREFPNAPEETLRTLLHASLRHHSGDVLRLLVQNVLNSKSVLGLQQHVLWLATGYLLCPDEYEVELDALLDGSMDATWAFYFFIGIAKPHAPDPSERITAKQAASIVRMIARKYRYVPRPPGVRSVGSHDLVEASHSVEGFIQGLAADISSTMTEALTTLTNDPSLQHWWSEIAHATATQKKARREAEYRYPDVDQVIATLANGSPANAADFQALIVSTLEDIKHDLRHGNSDGWKGFWNTDSHDKPLNPKVENSCRDRLMELLKPNLSKHGLSVEREGDFANHKRADLVVHQGLRKLPVEIKRSTHQDVWIAAKTQLLSYYSADPACEGMGIYLVFWFGREHGKGIPSLPSGGPRPQTACELEDSLIRQWEASSRPSIQIMVIDCAPPEA